MPILWVVSDLREDSDSPILWAQIVPGSDNTVAIELIATHIRRKIEDRSRYLRVNLARIGPRDLSPCDVPDAYFPNLTVLRQTAQLNVGIIFKCSPSSQN